MAARKKNPLSATDFAAAWAQVRPLILEEWDDLDAAELDATGGKATPVTDLVARHTGQTKVLTRRQLAELLSVATAPEDAPRAAPKPGAPRAQPPHRDGAADSSTRDPLDRLARSFEEHLDDIARQVKEDVTPLAIDSAREHLGLALLVSAGIGLMVGLFLGALGYPQEISDPEESDVDA